MPKGKPEGDETLAEAALREVEEETQCRVSPAGLAGRYAYDADGPKVVLVWHMRLEAERPFVPNDEMDERTWLTPATARTRLTYANERALVERTAFPGEE